jgi:hypothetical protein
MSFLDSTRSLTVDPTANAQMLHRGSASGEGGGTAGAEIEFVWVEWLVIQGRSRKGLVSPCTAGRCHSCLLFFKRAWDVPFGMGLWRALSTSQGFEP